MTQLACDNIYCNVNDYCLCLLGIDLLVRGQNVGLDLHPGTSLEASSGRDLKDIRGFAEVASVLKRSPKFKVTFLYCLGTVMFKEQFIFFNQNFC
ncbi:hypothetical protein K1T71_013261 [Dendrolimus kikuchii]|uniref:Uncharacterized protein n=1 Tax=Dendrolimus kikuchii TaxID=765133 RepID=A0ACC1CHL5_9NEOP|nr:hypothetical protein K1T71_013261 [Dendrolimus kikuchii]